MGSDAIKNYGAAGRTDLLVFEPEKLVLVTDTTHPLYDKRVHLPVDEAMVVSIMEQGVIEPIQVRRNGTNSSGPIVEVVFGRQRVKNAREANRRLTKLGRPTIRVLATWFRGDDAQALGNMMAENLVRKDVAPIERAELMRRYLAFGRSERDVSVVCGCTVQTVRDTLKLLELTPEVQAAVTSGDVAANAAKELADVPREKQGEALASMRDAGATKGQAALAAAREIRDRARQGKAPKLEPSDTKTVTKKMLPRVRLERWRKALAGGDAQQRIAATILAHALGYTEAAAKLPKDLREQK